MRPVQYFSDEYLQQCRTASSQQILEFLDNYRRLQASEGKSKLISLKVNETLLTAFRQRCDFQGVKYQTQIKQLMNDWLG